METMFYGLGTLAITVYLIRAGVLGAFYATFVMVMLVVTTILSVLDNDLIKAFISGLMGKGN